MYRKFKFEYLDINNLLQIAIFHICDIDALRVTPVDSKIDAIRWLNSYLKARHRRGMHLYINKVTQILDIY